MGMSTKSFSLDVFSTFPLKQVIDLLLPILQYIIIESLRMSYVPPALKRADSNPYHKKGILIPMFLVTTHQGFSTFCFLRATSGPFL